MRRVKLGAREGEMTFEPPAPRSFYWKRVASFERANNANVNAGCPMLPMENENRELIEQKFGRQLAAAEKVLQLGIEAGEKLGAIAPDGPAPGICNRVLQAGLYRLDSIIDLLRKGHVTEAEILCRSFFELALSSHFIQRTPSLPANPSDGLRGNFGSLEKLTDKSGSPVWSTIDARACIYDGRSDLSTYSLLVDLGHLPDDEAALPQEWKEVLSDIRDEITDGWVQRLRNCRHCGFPSVAMLSEYCGQQEFHASVYGLQSTPAHGAGAGDLVGGLNVSQLVPLLRLSVAMLGQIMENNDRAFKLGMEKPISDACDEFDREAK